MTTAERMKARRKELKYSADYVAEKLGVSRSTIFRYEAGDIEKLPIDILEPLSKILKTTPSRLMGWDDEHDADSPSLSKKEIDLIRKYNTLDDIGKYSVDTTLDAHYSRCARDYLEVVAAHNDDYSEEQQELIKKDLDMLEKLHERRTRPR